MKHVPIVVLDFGSQYTQIIARKLRESGVYSEIVPYNESIEDIMARTPKGIILSGGPASVYASDSYHPDFRNLLWNATYCSTFWWKCNSSNKS